MILISKFKKIKLKQISWSLIGLIGLGLIGCGDLIHFNQNLNQQDKAALKTINQTLTLKQLLENQQLYTNDPNQLPNFANSAKDLGDAKPFLGLLHITSYQNLVNAINLIFRIYFGDTVANANWITLIQANRFKYQKLLDFSQNLAWKNQFIWSINQQKYKFQFNLKQELKNLKTIQEIKKINNQYNPLLAWEQANKAVNLVAAVEKTNKTKE